MTPEQFYERISTITDAQVISLSPGPIRIKVNKQDAMAAKLLLWLFEQLPPDATYGNMDDVLDAAKWWSSFWASVETDAPVDAA